MRLRQTTAALSPRVVAVRGSTGTTVSHLPLSTGSILWVALSQASCAQPMRIVARELCELVKGNRRIPPHEKLAGHQIAQDQSRDETTLVLYCAEAVVDLVTQSHVQGANSAYQPEDITTLVIDEAHTRSVQSDETLAFTLLATQTSDRLHLVIFATGDHDLVKRRMPECQRLILRGTMYECIGSKTSCRSNSSEPPDDNQRCKFLASLQVCSRSSSSMRFSEELLIWAIHRD